MILTAEEIQSNWEEFIGYIDTYISEPRRTKLKEFYKKYEDRIIMMPASHKKEYHSAFPGGYIYHVNQVIKGALKINQVWVEMGVDTSTYTIEELVFSSMNHDLGKMGDAENEAYINQTDQWRREKLGEEYKHNDQLEFMSVPDRGLYLLQTHGINYSKVEFLTIKLHDGLYDDSNKPYLINWMPETKPRTSLIFIVHQADLMAARIEFEQEWFPKFKSKKSNFTLETKSEKPKRTKQTIKTKTLASIVSPSLQSMLNEI